MRKTTEVIKTRGTTRKHKAAERTSQESTSATEEWRDLTVTLRTLEMPAIEQWKWALEMISVTSMTPERIEVIISHPLQTRKIQNLREMTLTKTNDMLSLKVLRKVVLR